MVDRGALVCGGAARLHGLTDMLRDATGLPVLLADDPEQCVAQGAAKMLDDPTLLARSVDVT